MGSASLEELSQITLADELLEAGNKIKMVPSTDELILSLEKAESLLVQVGQRPPRSTATSLLPIMKAMVSDELLRHVDLNVQVAMASCFAEIARISAPDPSYCDDHMRDVFRILMVSFRQLSSDAGRSYSKAFHVLKTVAQVKLPVMLLDIGPEERIVEMFEIFLNTIRSTHPPDVFNYMEMIVTMVIKESDSISFGMLRPLLDSVRMKNRDACPSSWELGQKVFEKCAAEFKQSLKEAVTLKNLDVADYAEIISSICRNKIDEVSDHIVQNVLDAPIGDLAKELDGKKGAVPRKGGKKHSKDKDLESLSLKRKTMKGKMKSPNNSKKALKTEADGSSIKKGKKNRIHHDADLDVNHESSHHEKEQIGNEENVNETMYRKHVTVDVSKKTQKLKRPRVSCADEMINKRIKVWWPMDKVFYAGTVKEFDPVKKQHMILYDDNEVERLDLRAETWEFVDGLPPHEAKSSQSQETDHTAPVKKAVKTHEKAVKKKKALVKNKQLTASSSKRSKNEGQSMMATKSKESSTSHFETNASEQDDDHVEKEEDTETHTKKKSECSQMDEDVTKS